MKYWLDQVIAHIAVIVVAAFIVFCASKTISQIQDGIGSSFARYREGDCVQQYKLIRGGGERLSRAKLLIKEVAARSYVGQWCSENPQTRSATCVRLEIDQELIDHYYEIVECPKEVTELVFDYDGRID